MSDSRRVLFCPVHGLKITKEVGYRVQIGRVLFAAAPSIPRLRKRLGLKFPISHYRKLIPIVENRLLNNAEVYACLRTSHDWDHGEVPADLQIIRKSFFVFASAFATYKRRTDAAMSLSPVQFGEYSRDRTIIGEGEKDLRISLARRYVLGPNQTDQWWRRNTKDSHFRPLQQLMNGKKNVNPKWRATLVQSAALFGESFLAKDVATALLKNFIAIETLLTQRGDKFPDTIINRLVGLFGWMTGEDVDPWDEHIRRLYNLRCSYVHNGHSGEVKGMDLHEADELVRNLLDNLCRNTSWIKSKRDLIELAEACEARRLLQLRPKRPKSIFYSTRHLSDANRVEINDVGKWSW